VGNICQNQVSSQQDVIEFCYMGDKNSLIKCGERRNPSFRDIIDKVNKKPRGCIFACVIGQSQKVLSL
jgi:hypothetical protein